MINTIKIAMDADMNYDVIRDAIYTYPLTEVFDDLYSLI